MTEYSRQATGSFTSTGFPQIVNLPFQPDRIELYNQDAFAGGAVSAAIPFAWWNICMGQGTALVDVYNATPVLITDVITSGGFSTFAAGQLLQFGPVFNVSAVTKANPAQVTTSTPHGLADGDVVILSNLYQTSTTGMEQIAGLPFTVTIVDSTNFTIPWNTSQSNYVAYSSGSVQATVKKVLYPYLYFPGVSFISFITLGTTTTIETTDAHNFVVGQEVAFRIPTIWGTTQLNSLPDVLIPGSPIYGYVVSVTNYNTFVANIDSSAFTAFNSNIPFLAFRGLTWAQVVAVGDVNTGGVQISAGSPLYPSPYSMPFGTTKVPTINGPAILGSYVNNTSQGFIVGAGSAVNENTSVLVGDSGDRLFWVAYLDDITMCS